MTAALTHPRAPAARAKLLEAEDLLVELSHDIAELALEAAEGKAGSEKALSQHRSRVEAAERQVSELRRAVDLAERLDREAVARHSAQMRAEQLAAFKKAMAARERAMVAVLDAAGAMAAAFANYAQASLDAQAAAPYGTSLPKMQMGPLGTMGAAFGPGESLILAELWRIAPPRGDGQGRWALPFAKPPSPIQRDHRQLKPAIQEFKSANEAILRSVEEQVASLDQQQLAAASEKEKAA